MAAVAKQGEPPDGFRRRIPHLGVRAAKSHLVNGPVGLVSVDGSKFKANASKHRSVLLSVEN